MNSNNQPTQSSFSSSVLKQTRDVNIAFFQFTQDRNQEITRPCLNGFNQLHQQYWNEFVKQSTKPKQQRQFKVTNPLDNIKKEVKRLESLINEAESKGRRKGEPISSRLANHCAKLSPRG